MSSQDSFLRLRTTLGPTEEQRLRLLRRVRERMTTAQPVRHLRTALEPDADTRQRIWNRICEHIAPSRARSFLEHVRTYLTPEPHGILRLRQGFLPALQPVAIPVRPLKWVAAFAIIIITLRISPLLFLAPQTIAQSSVLLRPTKGVVTVSLDGLSQPIEQEVELLQSATMHTDSGEATILLHDDGTIRLAPETSVTLQDLTDRPEKGSGLATLLLSSGTVWVQGLVPDHLRGLSVVTPQGVVTVHGGSVSMTVTEHTVTVEVWDRHARLEREGQADLVLVAGERLTATDGAPLSIDRMPGSAFESEWPKQNLLRDAVHQRAIAQEQRERMAARAGILPTSRLYPVKRIAEEVDVLLTFNHETAVKKRLAQATTRLNEATTLIGEGEESGATVPMQEYQTAMLDIAGGSGDELAQALVEQGAAENVAQLGAQLPSDDVYVVKRLVLDTSAKLPSPPLDAADVTAAVVGDTVDALELAVSEGDDAAVQAGLESLAPYIDDRAGTSSLDPATKKEVLSRLTRVATTLEGGDAPVGGTGSLALRTVSRALRTHVPTPPPVHHLSDTDIAAMVDQILDRVFVYSQYTGQTNQLRQETLRLKEHPDEGMILRALYKELQTYEALNSVGVAAPDFRLSLLVRAAIRALHEERGGDID